MTTVTRSQEPALADLIDRLQAGDRRALARGLSWIENQRPGFEDLLHATHAGIGDAFRIGFTGPPGAGKSTLTEKYALSGRARGQTVGILAVDPSSPFTGGALLGDRIRMQELTLDEGAFVRSMATRGRLGGLATTSMEAADLLDAFGFDVVIHETVGVGQTERDIVSAADTTVVVLVPESGDAVQTMKAGLMEIAEVFVVNKADRPGADRLARAIRSTLGLRTRRDSGWDPPVVRTVAIEGEGLDDLGEAIDRHRAFGLESGAFDRKRCERAAERVRDLVARKLERRVWLDEGAERRLEAALDDIVAGRQSPYALAEEIVTDIGLGPARKDDGTGKERG